MKKMFKLGWFLVLACLLLTSCGKKTVAENDITQFTGFGFIRLNIHACLRGSAACVGEPAIFHEQISAGKYAQSLTVVVIANHVFEQNIVKTVKLDAIAAGTAELHILDPEIFHMACINAVPPFGMGIEFSILVIFFVHPDDTAFAQTGNGGIFRFCCGA